MGLAREPITARLPGGALLVAQRMSGTSRAVLTHTLLTGPRFEASEKAGLSHLVEHMLFRGTASYPGSLALARAFEDLGGSLHGSTASDHGNLSTFLPGENLSGAILRLAEVALSPTLSGLETEKGIIREEILEDLNEQGEFADGSTVVRELSFPTHGLGLPITGSLAHLSALTEADVRAHQELTYVSAGSVIVAVGDLDPERTLRELEDAYRALPVGARLTSQPPSSEILPYRLVRQEGSAQTSIHVAFRAPGELSPENAAVELLLRVLDDGMATRLYQRLCDSSGLCYDASASYEPYADAGLFEFATETSTERAPVVVAELLALVEEVASHGPTDDELARAKKRAHWQYQALTEDPYSLAEFLSMGYLNGTLSSPRERAAELAEVSRKAVQEAAASVFRPQARSVAIIGNPKPKVERDLERLLTGDAST